MRFSGIFAVSSLIVSAFALPATTFAPELGKLTVSITKLKMEVQNFDGSSPRFENMHKSALNMADETAKANSDLQKYSSFDMAESRENIVASEALVSGIEALCNAFIEKKTFFKNEKRVIIKMDITKVATPSFMLANNLVQLTPNIDKPKAMELQMRAVKALGEFSAEF